MFAVIVDALVDAAVAVGVQRDQASTMIFQAMAGTASLLQSGIHPALLRDQGTSPEGCTIAGLMVMEEGAVRGNVGKALREAVTVPRRMESETHLNDTRHCVMKKDKDDVHAFMEKEKEKKFANSSDLAIRFTKPISKKNWP